MNNVVKIINKKQDLCNIDYLHAVIVFKFNFLGLIYVVFFNRLSC